MFFSTLFRVYASQGAASRLFLICLGFSCLTIYQSENISFSQFVNSITFRLSNGFLTLDFQVANIVSLS